MKIPAGTPIISTQTTETDADTGAQCVLDMNRFAIVASSDVEGREKMRRELLDYLAIQVDQMLDGRAHGIRIEADKA